MAGIDIFSKRKRSEVMALVRSRGNASTELRLVRLLRASGIKGWRRHAKHLPGTPDFYFKAQKTILFADGCFWHGCYRCSKGRLPKNNAKYWKDKIDSNRRRDLRANRALRAAGWQVVRIWEHQLSGNASSMPARILRLFKINTALRQHSK